jgi:N-acyl-D-amino-acid deacylase
MDSIATVAPATRQRERPQVTLLSCLLVACLGPADAFAAGDYDVLIRGGTVYDGSGQPGRIASIAVDGDRIVRLGELENATAEIEIDASGLAVSPGFVNMLSWSAQSLMRDGRGLSDIAQGVTLEVLGEGWSLGPVPADPNAVQEALGFSEPQAVTWRTLSQGLATLAAKGISPNIASFAGATTIRIHELGFDDRKPSAGELAAMKKQVEIAMQGGAMGLSTSLIYPPAFYADTEELIELASVAAGYGGMYISHIRSEGAAIESAVNELVRIAREAAIPAEIYHLKLAGRDNWSKYDRIAGMIEAARAEGLRITANMYTYPAASTGLTAALPPWASEGGLNALIENLEDPGTRERILAEMKAPAPDWENLLRASGGAEGVLVTGVDAPALKYLQGKPLNEIARAFGLDAEETIMELIVRDRSRIDAIYFVMSEENVRRKISLPWMSFGSDAAAVTPEGRVLEQPTHPRAYGTFARVLGKYVREEGVLSLSEAVRRMTSFPAENLGIAHRGRLAERYFADVVVFDPETVGDFATFETPHRLSVGVRHVLVNGIQVLKDGKHTGALPGRVVRGPGYAGRHGEQ